MKAQLEHRLQELRSEFESGQKMLAELEAKQAELKTTLLRISGAMQVLEEELVKSNSHRGKPAQEPDVKAGNITETEERATTQ